MAATTWMTIANRAESALDGSILAGDGTLDVTTGEGALFPAAFDFMINVGDDAQGYELMLCTGRAGDTLTVTRAQEGDGALPFTDATDVKLRVTKLYVTNLQDAINNIEDGTNQIVGNVSALNIGAASGAGTGQIKAEAAGAVQHSILSGGAGDYMSIGLGRAAIEMDVVVVAGNDQFFTGTVAGDGVIDVDDNTKELFLGVGSGGPQMRIDNTTVIIPVALTVGGGYGSTGVSISAAGVIQADGAITTDDDLTVGG
ncbi:unnamed protein product, partial [marine sediment metagenome]